MANSVGGAAAWVSARPPIDGEAERVLQRQVAERQSAVGYEGNLRAWIDKVTPPGFV